MRRRTWVLLGVLITFVGLVLLVWGTEPARIRAGGLPLPWSSPPDYRIAYLLAEDAEAAGSFLAPSQLEATLGVQTIHGWNDLIAFDRSAPLDALIVHDSALSEIDEEWIASAYRRGVVMGVFNLTGPELAELVRDPCVAADNFAAGPYPGPFWVVASRLFMGSPEDVALIEAAWDSCGSEPAAGVRNPAGTHFGTSQNSLLNLDDYNVFAGRLVNQIEDVKELRQEFENSPDSSLDTNTP